MNKFAAILLLFIFFFSLTTTLSYAQLSVGVKSGDWIEYSVSSTGSPMQGHDVTWARMEILDVEGSNISVIITSRYSDSSTATTNYILDLQRGHLIDDFIIPANLNVEDTFKDENLGNVMITQVEQRTYAGAQRTVASASVGNNTYVWDQATGVSVEGDSKGPDWTIHTVVSDTNMWQPSAKMDWTSIGLIIVIVLIIVLVVVAVAVDLSKKGLAKKEGPFLSSLV
ncbi:MAG: hypothetical protein M1540_00490 [Candidatus Bathyarchaeota archaeon]|nr:hypothetical protein [Candidatus Bathyarchaeota archaeon]